MVMRSFIKVGFNTERTSLLFVFIFWVLSLIYKPNDTLFEFENQLNNHILLFSVLVLIIRKFINSLVLHYL